jgi:hypothetical protein
VDGPLSSSGICKADGGTKAVMRSAYVCGNMAAGPDGFREQHPNTATVLITLELGGFRCSSVRPIIISCYALKPSAPARGSGGYQRTPIRFTTRHHGPDDPGHLVGQSDRRDLARPALQQLQ